MILAKEDAKKEMETNTEKKREKKQTGKKVICYRLQEMRKRERWERPLYFNKECTKTNQDKYHKNTFSH